MSDNMVHALESRVLLSRTPIDVIGAYSGVERIKRFTAPFTLRIDSESAQGQVAGGVIVGDAPATEFAFTGTLKGRRLKFDYFQFAASVQGRANLLGRFGHRPLHWTGSAISVAHSTRTRLRFTAFGPGA